VRSAPLFAAATVSYAANCALGASVSLRLIDTRNVRWVHHALYLATFALATGAMSSAAWGTPRRASRRAAALLAPAAVPLALIPYAGTHTRRHPLVALSAAPFFAAALLRSRMPDDRK
jgi:hypothetical protein